MTPLWTPGLNLFMDRHFYLLRIPADLSDGNFTEMIILIQDIHRVPDNNFVKFFTWCLILEKNTSWKLSYESLYTKGFEGHFFLVKLVIWWSINAAGFMEIFIMFACYNVQRCKKSLISGLECELWTGRTDRTGIWCYHSVLLNRCSKTRFFESIQIHLHMWNLFECHCSALC